ncbi:acyltransferase family protein [Ruminococcus flavefaciens]|uniref:acyltransferase family protein n=1 Tax=Ruminococcus flavefaciens TaxID=1265 RepID=UPI0002F7D63E
MLILYALLILLLFIPFPEIKALGKSNVYHDDYLLPNNTLPIKGFFVVWVFFRHSRDYITISDTFFNRIYMNIDYYAGQLIVVAFLFYSGYGIYESIKTKGTQYIKNFPKKRLFRIWFRFAICLSFFLVFNIITNRTYPVKTILLSYIGWESIGNSNWYMFAIFSLYIFIYISFRFFKKLESVIPLIIFTLLASCFIDVLYFFELGIWWYNTILCFVSGMWYSRYKKEIDCVVQKNDIAYCRTLLCSIFIFAVLYYGHLKYSPQIMIFTAPIFALIIIFLSMKVKFRSKLLSFLGDHVFSIYILQRLAFLILKDKTTNQYLYFLSSLLLTIIISLLFDKVFNTIERSLRKRNIYRE